MKITISFFPGKVKKNTQESEMPIGTSRRESVISLLLLAVVFCVVIRYISFWNWFTIYFKSEFRM
jgi:hypothetical protein